MTHTMTQYAGADDMSGDRRRDIYDKYATLYRRRILRNSNLWDGRHRCWFCGGLLCWDSDFNYDEVHGEGEGIVAFLHCMDCGAEVQCSIRDDDEETKTYSLEEVENHLKGLKE